MITESHPLVTIAIPTYNRAARYLSQALESAVKQTYQNIEIIVADNCSIDDTELVVKGFSDRRIKYFRHSNNLGPDANWNFCLEQAKGLYFLLLQDDDLIDNDFVEVCMKAANHSTDIGIIRTGARIIDADGKVLHERENIAGGLSTEAFITAFLSSQLLMFCCCSLFNTKRLKEICVSYCAWTGTQYRHWEDVYSEIHLATRFGRIDIKDSKASYRKHSAQLGYNVKFREWVEDSIVLLAFLRDLVPQNQRLIRKKGIRYFATHNYEIASEIQSPMRRLIAYLIVFKTFKVFKDGALPSIYTILKRTHLYNPLRVIKVKTKQVFGGVLKDT